MKEGIGETEKKERKKERRGYKEKKGYIDREKGYMTER